MVVKLSAYIKTLIWVTLFGIAMAYLESAVVVYLRALMYPEGFSFPLAPADNHILITEVFREIATLIMLLGIAIISGKTFHERFAWFLYCFAIWDIFYYVFLKVLEGWPESLMTWDVLFLVPVTWVGPVITPVIASLTMILFAGFIIYFRAKGLTIAIKWKEWALLVSGSLILIISWSLDFSKYILEHISFPELFDLTNKELLFKVAQEYIPESFNWLLFWVGELIILAGIGLFFLRYRKK
jgi:hypothetical protein